MNKRTAAFIIALMSCPIADLCLKTALATWPLHTRGTLFALVCTVALFYIGLDLVIAPETSLLYRLEKNLRSSMVTPGYVRVMGIFAIFASLMFGWSFLGQLLGLI